MSNYYMIRVNQNDDLMRINKLYALEEMLSEDNRGEIRNVIASIDAVTAFLCNQEIVGELEEKGYELIPQEKTKMIEGNHA